MPYCSRCAAPLKDSALESCWHCLIRFAPESKWTVVDDPPFKFQQAPSSNATEPWRAPRLGVFGRAIIAIPVWLVLAVLAILSVAPYGGSHPLVTLWLLSTLVLPVWVLLPLMSKRR